MNPSQPWARSIAKGLGIYRPLHRWWIGVCARRTGCTVRHFGNGTFELQKDSRVIRYDKWDLAYFVATSFDYYFMSIEPADWNGMQLVDYSHPAWHRLKFSKELFYFHGLGEPEATTQLYVEQAALHDGDVVLDLGAYNGTQTVLFSRAVGPTGRVMALEPDPTSYAALKINLAFHRADNVTAIPTGAWSRSGRLRFSSNGTMGSSFLTEDFHDANSMDVEVISLEDLVAKYDLPKIDFIKMDIEGAELEVLKGATGLLRRFRPRLIIEPHEIDDPSGKKVFLLEPIKNLLSDLGYSCSEIKQGDFHLPLVLAVPV